MTPRFIRFGRAWHLEIDDAASLRQALELDDALWIATSAPISTLHADAGLLAALDPDGDGRIGLANLKEAVRWCLDNLADTSAVKDGFGPLALAAIKSPTLRASAETILRRAGATGAVTLDMVRSVRADEQAKGLATADRVLPAAADGDDGLKAYLEHAIDVTGGAPHPSGTASLSPETHAAFRGDLAAWTAWEAQSAAAHVLGDGTAAASAAIAAVAANLDAYFVLCDAALVDPGVVERAWPKIELEKDRALLDPAAVQAMLRAAPVARPNAQGRLYPDRDVNPAWAAEIRALFTAAAAPLGLGADGLDRAAWGDLRARIAPYDAWVAGKPRDGAKGRDAAVVAAHLASTDLPARVEDMFARSRVSAAEVAGFDEVERLVLFQGGLIPVCSSFVSCTDLFREERQPLFNAGELIADGRRFRLAIRVPDKARSLTFAPYASTFLVYANVGKLAGTWDYEVVVPVTAGERGTLIEGAYCAFVDREGVELIAQITKVIANPISIGEAILAPLVSVQRAVEGWLEARQAAAEAELTAKASTAALAAADHGVTAVSAAGATAYDAAAKAAAAPPAADAAKPGADAPAPAEPPAKDTMSASSMTAMLTGGSIAIAALGSAFALLGGFFSSLSPLGLFGVGLAVVGAFVVPTALLAWVKLRRRDVAALLEGSGWAVNHRMRVERPTAAQFTIRPKLPAGATTRGKDASDGPLPTILWTLTFVLLLLAVAWQFRDVILDQLGLSSPDAVEEAAPPPAEPTASAPAP